MPQVEDDARNPMLPFNLAGSTRLCSVCAATKKGGDGGLPRSDRRLWRHHLRLTLSAEYLYLKTGKRIPAEGMILDTREAPRREERVDSFPESRGS